MTFYIVDQLNLPSEDKHKRIVKHKLILPDPFCFVKLVNPRWQLKLGILLSLLWTEIGYMNWPYLSNLDKPFLEYNKSTQSVFHDTKKHLMKNFSWQQFVQNCWMIPNNNLIKDIDYVLLSNTRIYLFGMELHFMFSSSVQIHGQSQLWLTRDAL